MTPVEHALKLLREDARRYLYEAAAPNGRDSTGEYFVTYSNGHGPTLYRSDIEVLLRERTIVPKYQREPELHCYVLNRGVK